MQSIEHQALAFFRSKPADKEYIYTDFSGCAIFQFLEDGGYPVRSVLSGNWTDNAGRTHELPHVLRGMLDGGPGLVSANPTTFGALADRLEKALAQ